jgi:hypothetical protein
MSFDQPNWQYFTHPVSIPSAPSFDSSAPPFDQILDEEESFDSSLHPQVVPVYQGLYPQVTPLYSSAYSQVNPPTYSVKDVLDRATQAYLNVWPDLNRIYDLPTININDKSIETLKQMETKSNKGLIPGLLNLTIRVLQVVGKLALGIAVGISIALIVSLLLGASWGAVLFSSVIALPPLGILVCTRLGCKVTAYVLQRVRQKWIENSFDSTLTAKKDQVLQLKAWLNLKGLTQIEQRLQDAMQQIIQAQHIAGYHPYREQQIAYLTLTLQKIEGFQKIQQKLNLQNTFPLLNRFLSQ